MKEPFWRTMLNWGAVVTFLTLPLLLLSVQMWNWTHPGWIAVEPEKVEGMRKFITEYFRNVTILVFGLAGLRTWENIKNGNNKKDETKALPAR